MVKLKIACYDYYEEVDENISKEELLRYLEYCIPYIECDSKCARADYCKFVKWNSVTNRAMEIKCGVVVNVLRNFTYTIYPYLKTAKEKQIFIDACLKLIDFVYDMETLIGTFIDEKTVQWWGSFAPMLYWSLANHDKSLQEFRKLYSQLERRLKEGGAKIVPLQINVLLVEGETEVKFFEKLKEERILSDQVEVRDYQGIGNIKACHLLVRELIKYQGKHPFFIMDGDRDTERGKAQVSRSLKGFIKEDDFFIFQKDFEASFHPEILAKALYHYCEERKIAIDIPHQELLQKIGECIRGREPTVKCLGKLIGVDNIEKPELGEILGLIVAYLVQDREFYNDPRFKEIRKSEIFHLIEKIRLR